MRWEVFLESLRDPVVLSQEDDVERGEERLLIGPGVARHEVLRLLCPQLSRVGPQVQLLPRRKLVGVGIPLQTSVLISPIELKLHINTNKVYVVLYYIQLIEFSYLRMAAVSMSEPYTMLASTKEVISLYYENE